jgi:C-terminal processing protease CtpA/Prc
MTKDFPEKMGTSMVSQIRPGTKGPPVGVGMLLVELDEEDEIMVDKLLPDGPADRAGVQIGDVILSVDGKSAAGKRTADLVDWIVGDEGTTVKMQFRRGGKSVSLVLRRSSAIGWDEVNEQQQVVRSHHPATQLITSFFN